MYLTKTQTEIINEYCQNNMEKLRQLCNPMILRKGIPQMEWDDLYSLAQDTLLHSVIRFDAGKSCPFKTFLSGNLKRRFYDWTRDNHRSKRCNLPRDEKGRIVRDDYPPIHDISFEAVIEEGISLGDTIASDFNLEDAILRRLEGRNAKVEAYLNKLSIRQRKVITLLSDGLKKDDILSLLHISSKEFSECMLAIRAYENTKLLY